MRWTRAGLKSAAKQFLRKYYWHAFIVALIVGIFATGGSGLSSRTSNPRNFFNNDSTIFSHATREFENVIEDLITADDGYTYRVESTQSRYFYHRITSLFTPAFFGLFGLFATGFVLLFVVLKILIGSNLTVGGARYFVSGAENDEKMGYLGFGFRSGRYLNIMLAMFMKGVFTFLWSLLFVIPGIIKGYSYSMLPYILADNPSLGFSRALDISKQITRGHKLDMFILDLSFIGWYILGGLAFGVGSLFVKPYEMATHAQLYIVLRQNGIDQGITSYDELNLSVVDFHTASDESSNYTGGN